MMGPRQVDQAPLFYEFSLERHVPSAHLLRAIDRFVDLSDIRSHLAPFYSSTGRPSIDPELLVRMLLVGYCYGIRSERRLCEEVHLNLAYRWFCRLGLDGEVPDHSTFSKNRHGRFRDCDLLRKLFETVVRRCMAEGLVDGAAFAVDASLIAADANKQRSAAGSDDVDWEAIARTRRSVREYLDTLDEAAWGAASETVPKFISRSDPAAQWTGAHKGHAFFAYADNYLIDLKAAIIVDVEATRAIRQAEVGAARTMIERTEDRLGLCPKRLAADSAYGSAEMLGWLVNEHAIEPHIPVFDKSARDDGTFSREDFNTRSRGGSFSSGGRLTQGDTLTKSFPASAAHLNIADEARRMWRAFETDALATLPSTTYRPAAISFDKLAISLLVTSLAIFLPSLGLTKRSKWLRTFFQLSTRARISWSSFLTKVFIHSTRAVIT